MTVTLSFTCFIKIPQTLGREWAPTWNSTEGWTLPSKGQHEERGHPFKHSCLLSTSHSPSFHPPCTPVYLPSCCLQGEVRLPPTGYRPPTYRRLAEERQRKSVPTVFPDHMGRAPLSLTIPVAHNGVSPGILINSIYHMPPSCLGSCLGHGRGRRNKKTYSPC